MAKKQYTKPSKPTRSTPKKQNFKKKKPIDPNAMVYNFEEDIDEVSSDDGNF
jgi:hypothetical protein